MVNDKQFLLRLPDEMRSAVADQAEHDGCTQSAWIRVAIMEKLVRSKAYTGDKAEMPNTPQSAKRKKNAWWL